MAFQPIVDVETHKVYAYEALVRGPNNESARSVLSRVTKINRYAFDQSCRVVALTLARRLELDRTGAKLSVNFTPGAMYDPVACIRPTLKTAKELSFPLDRLIFEVTEAEEVKDPKQLIAMFAENRRHGFQLALDDFGSGFCGLNLFVDATPDILKIDMDLTRNLHMRPVALATTEAIVRLCDSLAVQVVAEGVETVDEYAALHHCGVRIMQGYLLAKPEFQKTSRLQHAGLNVGRLTRGVSSWTAWPLHCVLNWLCKLTSTRMVLKIPPRLAGC